MPTITTMAQAKAFANSDLGKQLPFVQEYYLNAKDTAGKGYAKGRFKAALAKLDEAASNPTQYALNSIDELIARHTLYSNTPAVYSKEHTQNVIKNVLNAYDKTVNFLNSNNVSNDQINEYTQRGYDNGLQRIKDYAKNRPKSEWYDKMFDVAEGLMKAGLTANLPFAERLVGNAALSAASGAPIKDVGRNVAGQLAGDYVGKSDFAQDLGSFGGKALASGARTLVSGTPSQNAARNIAGDLAAGQTAEYVGNLEAVNQLGDVPRAAAMNAAPTAAYSLVANPRSLIKNTFMAAGRGAADVAFRGGNPTGPTQPAATDTGLIAGAVEPQNGLVQDSDLNKPIDARGIPPQSSFRLINGAQYFRRG